MKFTDSYFTKNQLFDYIIYFKAIFLNNQNRCAFPIPQYFLNFDAYQ